MHSPSTFASHKDIFCRRAIRNTRMLYTRRHQFSRNGTSKSFRRDLFIYLKPVSNYITIPFKNGYDFLKLLSHEASFKVPDYELALNSVYYSKALKTFNSYELSLSNRNSKDLIRILKTSSRSIRNVILSFNRFRSLSPQECEQIYLNIFKKLKVIKNVEYFELVLATFTQQILENIHEGMHTFQKLKTFTLNLPQFPVTFQQWEPIAKVIAHQTRLQDLELNLSLAYNYQPETPQLKFFDFLLQLKNLETLSLNVRQRIVDNFLELSENKSLLLENLKKLSIEVISLQVDDKNASGLFARLNLPKLNYFRLVVSRIQGPTAGLFQELPRALNSCQALTTLVLTLSFCELKPETYTALRQSFTPSLKILRLTIRQQSITYECHNLLFQEFSRLSELTELFLDVSATRLHCISLTKISMAIGSLSALEKLSLNIGLNEIQDQGINKLAGAVASLQNLTFLSLGLYDNKMSYISVHQLIESIKLLSRLNYLNLSVKSCRNLNKDMVIKLINLIKTYHPSLKESKSLIFTY